MWLAVVSMCEVNLSEVWCEEIGQSQEHRDVRNHLPQTYLTLNHPSLSYLLTLLVDPEPRYTETNVYFPQHMIKLSLY